MSDVDALIDQLFPGTSSASGQRASPQGRTQSEWDSPLKDAGIGGSMASALRGGGEAKHPSPQKTVQSNVVGATNAAGAHAPHVGGGRKVSGKPRSSFDDSSDDEGDRDSCTPTTDRGAAVRTPGSGNCETYATSAATQQLAGHTVPFPAIDPELCGACHHRCVVMVASSPHVYHPSLSDLRTLHERIEVHTPRNMAMKHKGALHAYLTDASVGNGAASDGGACVHIVCRRCDHGVVRLSGAAWEDQGGRLDLYLALRNYYPDWARLASLTSVDTRAPLLVAADDAAAYCCQCSWLTVHGNAPFTITTSSMDLVACNKAAAVRNAGDVHCAFATHVPLAAGETRRPPLWECRGHNVFKSC